MTRYADIAAAASDYDAKNRAGKFNQHPASREAIPATPVEILVQMPSQSGVSQYHVVELGIPVFTEDVFASSTAGGMPIYAAPPTLLQDVATFAVVQEPIAASGMGRAVVMGLTPAKLYVTSTEHKYAEPSDQDTILHSTATPGNIRIVYHGTTDDDHTIPGEMDGIVLIGAGGSGGSIELRHGTLTQGQQPNTNFDVLSVDTHGTVTIPATPPPDELSPPGDPETVTVDSIGIASGYTHFLPVGTPVTVAGKTIVAAYLPELRGVLSADYTTGTRSTSITLEGGQTFNGSTSLTAYPAAGTPSGIALLADTPVLCRFVPAENRWCFFLVKPEQKQYFFPFVCGRRRYGYVPNTINSNLNPLTYAHSADVQYRGKTVKAPILLTNSADTPDRIDYANVIATIAERDLYFSLIETSTNRYAVNLWYEGDNGWITDGVRVKAGARIYQQFFPVLKLVGAAVNDGTMSSINATLQPVAAIGQNPVTSIRYSGLNYNSVDGQYLGSDYHSYTVYSWDSETHTVTSRTDESNTLIINIDADGDVLSTIGYGEYASGKYQVSRAGAVKDYAEQADGLTYGEWAAHDSDVDSCFDVPHIYFGTMVYEANQPFGQTDRKRNLYRKAVDYSACKFIERRYDTYDTPKAGDFCTYGGRYGGGGLDLATKYNPFDSSIYSHVITVSGGVARLGGLNTDRGYYQESQDSTVSTYRTHELVVTGSHIFLEGVMVLQWVPPAAASVTLSMSALVTHRIWYGYDWLYLFAANGNVAAERSRRSEATLLVSYGGVTRRTKYAYNNFVHYSAPPQFAHSDQYSDTEKYWIGLQFSPATEGWHEYYWPTWLEYAESDDKTLTWEWVVVEYPDLTVSESQLVRLALRYAGVDGIPAVRTDCYKSSSTTTGDACKGITFDEQTRFFFRWVIDWTDTLTLTSSEDGVADKTVTLQQLWDSTTATWASGVLTWLEDGHTWSKTLSTTRNITLEYEQLMVAYTDFDIHLHDLLNGMDINPPVKNAIFNGGGDSHHVGMSTHARVGTIRWIGGVVNAYKFDTQNATPDRLCLVDIPNVAWWQLKNPDVLNESVTLAGKQFDPPDITVAFKEWGEPCEKTPVLVGQANVWTDAEEETT